MKLIKERLSNRVDSLFNKERYDASLAPSAYSIIDSCYYFVNASYCGFDEAYIRI